MQRPDDERAEARRRASRSAWGMAAAGSVLLLSSLAIGDQRWRSVALILGALLVGVGVLTLAWRSVEDALPWHQRD